MTRALAFAVALLLASSSAAANDGARFRVEPLLTCTIASTSQELPPGAEIRVRVASVPEDVGLGIALRAASGIRHVPSFRSGRYQPGELSAGQVISYKVTETGSYALYAWNRGKDFCVSGAIVDPASEYDRVTLGRDLQLDVKVIMPAF